MESPLDNVPERVRLARRAADEAPTSLLIGRGAVALLVAGAAIANIMVISVLERSMEIGSDVRLVRRAAMAGFSF